MYEGFCELDREYGPRLVRTGRVVVESGMANDVAMNVEATGGSFKLIGPDMDAFRANIAGKIVDEAGKKVMSDFEKKLSDGLERLVKGPL